jgi:hypothetical protein
MLHFVHVVVAAFLCIAFFSRLLVAHEEAGEFITAEATAKVRIVMLTSYFVNNHLSDHHAHYAEIQAALVANLMNPHFHEVCVVYDGVTAHQDCSSLRQELFREGRAFKDWSVLHENRLTCVDRTQPQPSYREMYEFAFTLPLKGDVVILSNADIVFDETIAKTRAIAKNHLMVLSVTGGPRESPASIQRFFPGASRNALATASYKNMCDSHKNKTCSWDAYVFRRDNEVNITAALPYFIDMGDEPPQEFKMNVFGAENAAAYAMHKSGLNPYTQRKGSGSGSGSQAWLPRAACRHVHAWHFHKGEKMHAHNRWVARVRPSCTRSCKRMENCLLA